MPYWHIFYWKVTICKQMVFVTSVRHIRIAFLVSTATSWLVTGKAFCLQNSRRNSSTTWTMSSGALKMSNWRSRDKRKEIRGVYSAQNVVHVNAVVRFLATIFLAFLLISKIFPNFGNYFLSQVRLENYCFVEMKKGFHQIFYFPVQNINVFCKKLLNNLFNNRAR